MLYLHCLTGLIFYVTNEINCKRYEDHLIVRKATHILQKKKGPHFFGKPITVKLLKLWIEKGRSRIFGKGRELWT